jgi:hypothetical protein
MSANQKLLIAIKDTSNPEYKIRAEECYNTWGKEFEKLGVDLIFLKEDPLQLKNYIFKDKSLYSRAAIEKEGIFYKYLYYPFEWFIKETKYEYLVIVDSDTFVHPQKFLNRFEFWRDKYPQIELIGSALPIRGWNFMDPHLQILSKENKYWPSGCLFVVKRSLINKFITEFDFDLDELTYHDDYTLGMFCNKRNIPFLHDSSICFQSPTQEAHVSNPFSIPIPFIGSSEGSHLIAQHYLSGQMGEIFKNFSA